MTVKIAPKYGESVLYLSNSLLWGEQWSIPSPSQND